MRDLSRRSILTAFGGGLALSAFGPALAQATFDVNPFRLGVAAGDPAPDGFVIWTKLAPDPLAFGGGMPHAPMAVKWEVAADRGFQTIVRSGETVARPELGHSVHVEVAGLEAARPYFYRFQVGDERSGVGRAKTTPLAGASVAAVRFGVAGCQAYESGYYTAHRKLADEDLDFIFFYGDYIYEGRGNPVYQSGSGPQDNTRVHLGGEVYSLDDYRRRYAQYTSDTDLQASRASAAWLPVFDDHEVDNDWTSDIDQDATDPALFLLRRAAAFQAWYEMMPVRRASLPTGANIQLYRQARYGNLLDLNLLDTRQFRSDQPCDDDYGTSCAGMSAPDLQMLGEAQERWLFQTLDRSDARWKALAQQVMMMDLDRDWTEGYGVNTDSWAAYTTPRARLLHHLKDRRIANTVVLTGDEHQNFAGELHIDGRWPGETPVAVEFVATSISSGGDGGDTRGDSQKYLDANPQLKFINNQRGYVVCDVTPERFQAEFKVLDKVSERGGALSTRAKWAVASGETRLQQA